MTVDDTSGLQSLGSGKTDYKYDQPNVDILETFPNRFPENDYTVDFESLEFTSLCPKTGQPDFAKIKIEYNPRDVCIESKSLKLYLFAWRGQGCFMETITNTILADLVKACNPKYMKVTGEFAARGGIKLTVHADYWAEDYCCSGEAAEMILHTTE